jgi:hypothetical protein
LFNLSVKQVPVSKFWLRPCDRSALWDQSSPAAAI